MESSKPVRTTTKTSGTTRVLTTAKKTTSRGGTVKLTTKAEDEYEIEEETYEITGTRTPSKATTKSIVTIFCKRIFLIKDNFEATAPGTTTKFDPKVSTKRVNVTSSGIFFVPYFSVYYSNFFNISGTTSSKTVILTS